MLYHRDHYNLPGFPFAPLTPESVCRWVIAIRVHSSGAYLLLEHWWQVFLASSSPISGPSISTGLSAGKVGDPGIVRGLQEVIERDALVGAWWGLLSSFEGIILRPSS